MRRVGEWTALTPFSHSVNQIAYMSTTACTLRNTVASTGSSITWNFIVLHMRAHTKPLCVRLSYLCFSSIYFQCE